MLVEGQDIVGHSRGHRRATGHGVTAGIVGAGKAPPGGDQGGSGDFVGVGASEARSEEHGIEAIEGVRSTRGVFHGALAPFGRQDDHAVLFEGISVSITNDVRASPEDSRRTSTVAVRPDEVCSGVTGRGSTLLESIVWKDHGHGGGEVRADQDNDAIVEWAGREQWVSRVESSRVSDVNVVFVAFEDHGHSSGKVRADQDNDAVVEWTGREQRVSRVQGS